LEFRVLGAFEAWHGDERLELGALKRRALLALLLLHRGEAVSTDRLVDELWGERAPQTAAKSIQVYVSGLRKELPEGTLQTRGHGYALDLDGTELDADRFEQLLTEGRRMLADGDARAAASSLRESLSLWRGPALADFAYEGFAQEEIARLEELRLSALEERIDADLALERHADLVPELTALTGEHPLRERMRGQLMLALYRSGRQSEALETYRSARTALLEERGLEPGPALRELEAAILRQDPSLGARAPRVPAMRRSRRVGGKLIAAGGAALLVAAAAAVIALVGKDPHRAVLADGVAAIPASGGGVASFTRTTAVPGNVTVGEGSVWVLNAGGSGTISRIDPDSKRVVKTLEPGGLPVELVAGEGAVWIGTVGPGSDANSVAGVSRVDPRSGKVTARLKLPGARGGVLPTAGLPRIATGAGAVWAINPDGSVSRIDPKTGRLAARIRLEHPAWTIAAGDAGVWFLSLEDGSAVTGIDPRTNAVSQTVRTGAPFLWGVAVGAGSVWATSRETGLLWRVEPGRRPVSRTIDVRKGVTSVAFGENAIWTGNYVDGTVSRIDVGTNRVTERTDVDAPQSIAAGAGSVWVSVAGRTTSGPLQASTCGEVASGGARPDVLIASDLPLQGPSSGDPRQMANAIRFVLERHHFRAGKHVVGYQSCDVSTAETGGFEFRRCASNANAYAHSRQLVAVLGTYSSFCAEVEIPILNRAREGPVAMIGSSTTGPNLTRGGPLALTRDEPDTYYPTGVRNFFRVVPREDLQGVALALLADKLGERSVYSLHPRGSDWDVVHAAPFRRAARRLGLHVAGAGTYDPSARAYTGLARRVARSGARAIFLTGFLDDGGGRLLRALREQRLRVMIADTFGLPPDVLDAAGPTGGVIYMSSTDLPAVTRRLTPAGERFARDFGELQRSTQFVLPAAQAAEVLLQAIARSDGTRATVLRELRRTRVEDGILGSFRFDRTNDIVPATVPIFRLTRASPPGAAIDEAVLDRVLKVPAAVSD
jgi:DNA-binding SARP family transcriptional activator/ABC-type branched-subunit amino acid transport system substrate-binding protein